MSKRSFAALVGLTLFAGFGFGQQPPQYSVGRKAPDPALFHALRADSITAHVDLLAGIEDAKEPKWDSREKGWIGPVKNQWSCGSCWDFSGTFVVETAFNKAGIGGGKDKFVLSEQYTLSCYDNGGCGGDDNTTVLKHAKRVGLPLTADYGVYKATEARCGYKPEMKRFQIVDWGFADGSAGYEQVGNTQKIKNAIKAFGCVGCAIAADNAFMNVRPGQVFNGHARDINHDVALIGWDDATGAWLLRNSWGSWCDGGYCWIKYGANMVGTEPVFAVVNAPAPPPTPPAPHPHASHRIVLGVVLLTTVGVVVGVVLVVLIRSRKVG